MLDPALLAPERVRGLKRVEYDALVEQGVFDDERVELLRGVLVEMSPQGEPHSQLTAWLAQRLAKLLDFDRYDVRSHSPYAATEDSEPEPDVSVSLRALNKGHPHTSLLLIEVSGSSLAKDRSIKTEIYAEAGVPEYWIVNVRARQVEVLTQATRRGYLRRRVFGLGDVLRPRRLPGIAIATADLPWVAPPSSRKRRARRR